MKNSNEVMKDTLNKILYLPPSSILRVRETINNALRAYEPMKDVLRRNEAMKIALGGHEVIVSQTRETINNVLKAYEPMKDVLQKNKLLPSQAQEAINNASRAYEPITFTLNRYEQLTEKLGIDMKSITEKYLTNYSKLDADLYSTINDLINIYKERSKQFNMDIDEININEDGTISIDRSNTMIEEIKETIDMCIKESGIPSMNDIISNLNSQIEKTNQPLIKQILIGLIINLIFYILTPLIPNPAEHIVDNFYKNKVKIVKHIKKEVSNNIISNTNDLSLDEKYFVRKEKFNDYRFVVCKSLNVRETNSTKSRVIGKLYFTQVVRMVEKRKNWVLIEYYDENNEVSITGWVFSKYIKRFDSKESNPF